MVVRCSDFRQRKCAKSEQPLEDHISLLPSDILVYILSCLTLKEATRASVLSKRWMGLWTFAGKLDFDASEMLQKLAAMNIPAAGDSVLGEERSKYVKWVNKVLQSHKALMIDEFRICFELDKSSQDDIDKWLRYAFARRVQRLELDLLKDGEPLFLIPEAYPFPCRLLDQNSEKSSEESPSFYYEKGIRTLILTDFKSLRSLSLAGVNVTGEVLKFFLDRFHSLERLIVRGSSDLLSVEVCGSSLALKYLEITYCTKLKSIILRDTCLVSLKITWVVNLVLENVPMLVDIWVTGLTVVWGITPQLSSCLSRVEVLTLCFSCVEVRMVNKEVLEVAQLTELKQLILIVHACKDDSIIHLTSLIRSSPKLEKFVLELDWEDNIVRKKREFEKASGLPLQHLKVVELRGYYGRTADDELVMYLLENAVALERIIVDPRNHSIFRRRRWEYPKKEKIAKIRAEKQLKGFIPSSVELVIL